MRSAIIRKSGRLDDYLDRMEHIAAVARRLDVPWGANVICGHPGETEASMRRSAAWLSRLFGREGGVTGFLSVDPFRLYPGSPIDAERGMYEARYGTRFHRPRWWDDGDPAFLSEWVDPSAELDWATRERLQHELLGPVLAGIEGNFAYGGKARPYFLRAIREQVQFAQGRARLWDRGRYYAWQSWLGRRRRAESERSRDRTLAELCRAARDARLAEVCARAGIAPEGAIARAIRDTPRERFVPIDQVEESTRDLAIALDDSGAATVSAMHAYARSFDLLAVTAGDTVLDLGAGTGYGTAILRALVGERGEVVALEIDPALVERAADILGPAAVACGDALDPTAWPAAARACRKVTVGFTLAGWPAAWTDALAPGTVVVAPLREGAATRLVRVTVGDDRDLHLERFEPVSYVDARREVVHVRPNPPAPVHLPVVD